MTAMTNLPALAHRLDRVVVIEAPRDVVFRYFTDAARWAQWWGAGSTIDARPGGRMYIRYPEGTEVLGEVLEVNAPERISFTYGYASGQMIAPGGSRVTIRLEAEARGTHLHFLHEFDDAAVRDVHVQGWRYQLSVFSNVVMNEVHSGVAALVDEWFDVWAEPDASRRRARLDAIATSDVSFRDRFSLIDGADELCEQISASQHFMPGVRMQRHGDVAQCQGTAIADWIVHSQDGQERGRGTNVYRLGPQGKIASVVGIWR
ncbi:MAG TPA: SRPBCC domain-containing protein [Vicinamibacterales bacterium]